MYFLTYVSQAAKGMKSKDLDQILKAARINNGQHEISGLLLERAGTFFQFIEGEKSSVLAIFQKIAKDKRHNKVEIIFEIEVENASRIFPTWEMGFVGGELTPATQQALIGSLHALAKAKKPEKNKILELLKQFSNTAPESGRAILAQTKSAKKRV